MPLRSRGYECSVAAGVISNAMAAASFISGLRAGTIANRGSLLHLSMTLIAKVWWFVFLVLGSYAYVFS